MVLYRLLLAFALIAGQQAFSLHELSHGISELSQKNDAPEPADHVCEKCLALASLGHSLSSVIVVDFAQNLSYSKPSPARSRDAQRSGWLAYRSRAPPALS